jgi:hypothetical protein
MELGKLGLRREIVTALVRPIIGLIQLGNKVVWIDYHAQLMDSRREAEPRLGRDQLALREGLLPRAEGPKAGQGELPSIDVEADLHRLGRALPCVHDLRGDRHPPVEPDDRLVQLQARGVKLGPPGWSERR